MVFLPLEKVRWGCEAWNSCGVFVENLGSIPGLGSSPGERNGYPLQYSGLENSMDCVVHDITKSQKRLSDFHFHFFWGFLVAQLVKILPAVQETWVQSQGQKDPLEKEMAPHSSILAWKIPWTEQPGGLQSMGSQRVGHDWVTNTFTFWYKGEEQGWEWQACHRKESRDHWHRDTGPVLEDTENIYTPDMWAS